MRPFKLTKPFQNLTIPQSILQKARLITSFGALVCIALVLIIPYLDSNAFYCARINCARGDLSEALYNSLRTSVTSTEGDTPVDATLTNSQVIALTDYTESLYASAPQFTINSLWRWCSGNYIQVKSIDRYGQVTYKDVNQTLTCYDYHPNQNQSIFDYVGQLESIGLQSIMAYAYNSDDDDTVNSGQTPEYRKRVHQRSRLFRLVIPALGLSAILQVIIIIFTFILYSSRFETNNEYRQRDLNGVPQFLLHIVTVLTCVAFIAGCVGASIITRIMLNVQNEIKDNLENWGIFMKLGNIFVLVLWWGIAFSALVMLSWALPVWCANPVNDDYFDNEDYSHHHNLEFSRRTTSTLPKSTRRNTGQKENASSKLAGARRIFGGKKKNNVSFHEDDDVQPERNRLIGEDGEYAEEIVELDNDSAESLSDSPRSALSLVAGGSTELYHSSPIFEEKNEEALRQLGRSLSRKSSVRHINRSHSKSKTKVNTLETQQEEPTIGSPSGVGRSASQHSQQHYREETFDGYGQGKIHVQTHTSEPEGELELNDGERFTNQRNLLDILKTRPKRESTGSSFLNDNEIELLDFDDQLNKL